MKKILFLLLFASSALLSFGADTTQSFRCPTQVTICATACSNLRTTIPNIKNSSNNYRVYQIAGNGILDSGLYPSCRNSYTSTYTPGAASIISVDDQFAPVYQLSPGFIFKFYGVNYTKIVASSNGFITFDSTRSGFAHYSMLNNGGFLSASTGAPQDLPSALYERAIIMGPYQDVNPSTTTSPQRLIKQEVQGTAPYRRYVLSFNKVPLFSCTSLIENTYQIILYETYNVIEVLITRKQSCMTWNLGHSMIGIQNWARNQGLMAPNRKASSPPWSVDDSTNPEGWRFVPTSGSPTFKSVNLYNLSTGTMVATGDTTDLNDGRYDVSFTGTITPGSYVVRSVYENPNQPGFYIVGRDTIDVILDSNVPSTPPPPTLAADTIRYCKNSTSIPLSATASTGSYLLWYKDTVVCGKGVGTPPSPNTSVVDTFLYFVTNKNGCAEGPAKRAVVIIDSLPKSPVYYGDTAFCGSKTNITLLANPHPGSNLYWYKDTTLAPLDTNASYTITTTLTDTTKYYLKEVNSLGCKSDKFYPITVFINEVPLRTAPNIMVDRCGPGKLNFIALVNDTIKETVDWYKVPSFGSIVSRGRGTRTFVSPYIPDSTIVTYYAQIRNIISGCVSDTPRYAYYGMTKPTPKLGPDFTHYLCFNDSVSLISLIDTINYASNVWTIKGNIVPNPGKIKVQGVYQVIVKNKVYNCPDTAQINLIILPAIMPFAGNDTIATTGGDHQLVATCLTPQIGITQYLWSPTTFLKNQIDSIKRKPIVVLSDDQLFVVKITNMIGCSENDSVFVKVFPGPGYNSPNAFTPNGDGVNDIFRVIPAGIDNTIWFKIFNRFGDLVFQSSRWLRGWDGTKNGVKQPPGTYVWMVKGFDVNGKVIQSKGTVILLP